MPNTSPSTESRVRFSALDGLRGFAALSVFLSHVTLYSFGIQLPQWLSSIWQFFSEGANSVQILFVLSGFLMSALYTHISRPRDFIAKRYARIFPVLSTVVVFLWVQQVAPQQSVYAQVLALLACAVLCRVIWKGITYSRYAHTFGWWLLTSFLLLQVLMVGVQLFLTPHLMAYQKTISLLANLTLTTAFAAQVPPLTVVLWSLAPEVIFYLIFPFVVLPLIQLSSRSKWIVSGIIIVGTVKILFDLHQVLYAFPHFNMLSIGRASGFIIGVICGRCYVQKNSVWKFTTRIVSHPIGALLVLCSWAIIHGWDAYTGIGQRQETLLWYYLISSICIGGLVITLTQASWVTRLFSHKVLVFLGTISYSLYLIHRNVFGWVLSLSQTFKWLPPPLFSLAAICLTLVCGVGVSWILYMVVERLYFEKQKSTFRVTEPPKGNWLYSPIVGGGLISGIIIAAYAVGYPLSILVTQEPSKLSQSKVTLSQAPVVFPLVARYTNLSIVGLQLQYHAPDSYRQHPTKPPAQLLFTLSDAVSGRVVFESTRDAIQVEGMTVFPFGFPTQPDSSGKRYLVTLKIISPNEFEEISLHNKPVILHYLPVAGTTFYKLQQVLQNRLYFALSQTTTLFALFFTWWIVYLSK